jgi:integrase
LAHAEGDRLAMVFELALATGLRRGELAGLRWVDADLDAAQLAVRRNRVSVGYDAVDGTPKAGRARTIDLDEGTVAALRAHRRRQLEERMAWGEAWDDNGLVFTRENGAPLHPQTLLHHLRRLSRAAGVPAVRLHDLRHTHATWGLAAGVPAKVMQERLGHSSVQITLDLYSHVIPGMQADAAARIRGLLRGARLVAEG